jgi:hypothetical protein
MRENYTNIKDEDNLELAQKFDDIDQETHTKAVVLIGLLLTVSFGLLLILLSSIFRFSI